jgi:hypothetical protein
MSDKTKPALTELLDLLNKPALVRWANKLGLEGTSLDSYRNRVRNAGANWHKQVEMCLKHGICIEDSKVQAKFEQFMIGKQVVAVEESFEHELFVGRCDVRFKIGGHSYVCDFKPKVDVYLETVLQLTGYRMATGDDRVAVISLPNFTFKPLAVSNFDPYENILKALVSIWHAKVEIGGLNL